MRIAIVTDAWHPQVNGVANTLATTAKTARELGHEVQIVEPTLFRTLPCPTYPEIRLAWRPYRGVATLLTQHAPDAIHIATEGPLGWAARRWCLRQRLPFTTSYHTQFPEYLRARAPVPLDLSYALMRRFHGSAARTMVATMSLELTLRT